MQLQTLWHLIQKSAAHFNQCSTILIVNLCLCNHIAALDDEFTTVQPTDCSNYQLDCEVDIVWIFQNHINIPDEGLCYVFFVYQYGSAECLPPYLIAEQAVSAQLMPQLVTLIKNILLEHAIDAMQYVGSHSVHVDIHL